MWKYGLFSEMVSAVTGSRSSEPAPDGPRRTSVFILELLSINSNISEAENPEKIRSRRTWVALRFFIQSPSSWPQAIDRTVLRLSFQSLSRGYGKPCTDAIVPAPRGWSENLVSAFEPRDARIRHPKIARDSNCVVATQRRPAAKPRPCGCACRSGPRPCPQGKLGTRRAAFVAPSDPWNESRTST